MSFRLLSCPHPDIVFVDGIFDEGQIQKAWGGIKSRPGLFGQLSTCVDNYVYKLWVLHTGVSSTR